MKNFMIVIAMLAFVFTSCKKDKTDEALADCNFIDFRYYQDAPLEIGELSPDYILIGLEPGIDQAGLENLKANVDGLDPDHVIPHVTDLVFTHQIVPLKTDGSKSCEEISTIINDLKLREEVSYAHFCVKTDNCNNLIWEPLGDLCVDSYSDLFRVKVHDANNLTLLNEMMSATNTLLVEQIQSSEDWFTVRATKHSDGDALKMANAFYETGYFLATEPQIFKMPVE